MSIQQRYVSGVAIHWILLAGAILMLAAPAWGQADHDEVAARVNQLLGEEVSPSGQDVPAPRIDDQTYLRRIFLDILGEIPTPEDLLAFSLDSSPRKRMDAVDTLLADKVYGENWARYWRDVIFYRRTEERAAIAIRPMEEYLADRFNKNMSWDDIASSFITALGDAKEVGSAGLIIAQGGQPEETVAELSRIFLGIQIQCAQCHDHPTDRWTRDQFHELAAFFPRVAIRPGASGQERTFSVVAQDHFFRRPRQNANNRFVGTPEHQMPDLEDPGAPGTQMQPVFFLTGEKLEIGTSDADRRGFLADWITARDNPWFAKALVNRIWSELVGEGFYEPVDDMGPDRTPTAPRTLEYLAQQFVDNEYDMKWLFRTIVATDVYQRESRPRRNHDQTPFMANCNQRLRGDQLYSSLAAALEFPELSRQRTGGYGVRRGPRDFFNIQFGYDPSEPRDEVGGSIPQALMMMNSPIIQRALSARPSSSLGRLLREIDDNEELVIELYVKTLAREPTRDELRTCLSYIRSVGNRVEATEDLMWALINSTEFIHRR